MTQSIELLVGGVDVYDNGGGDPVALAPAQGGTGQNTYAIGDLLYASSPTELSRLAAGTVNWVLTSGGPGVAPSWRPAPGTTP